LKAGRARRDLHLHLHLHVDGAGLDALESNRTDALDY
jgi:hypothetical protein